MERRAGDRSVWCDLAAWLCLAVATWRMWRPADVLCGDCGVWRAMFLTCVCKCLRLRDLVRSDHDLEGLTVAERGEGGNI